MVTSNWAICLRFNYYLNVVGQILVQELKTYHPRSFLREEVEIYAFMLQMWMQLGPGPRVPRLKYASSNLGRRQISHKIMRIMLY